MMPEFILNARAQKLSGRNSSRFTAMKDFNSGRSFFSTVSVTSELSPMKKAFTTLLPAKALHIHLLKVTGENELSDSGAFPSIKIEKLKITKL